MDTTAAAVKAPELGGEVHDPVSAPNTQDVLSALESITANHVDLKKVIENTVHEAMNTVKESILQKIQELQYTTENLPAATLGIFMSSNSFAATLLDAAKELSHQSKPRSSTTPSKLPEVEFLDHKVWIGDEAVMSTDEFEEAQLKPTLGMRLGYIAEKMLPGGLAGHSLSGPTEARPDLLKLTEDKIEAMTALLQAMSWLDRSTVIKTADVKTKLRQLTCEARREEVNKSKKSKLGIITRRRNKQRKTTPEEKTPAGNSKEKGPANQNKEDQIEEGPEDPSKPSMSGADGTMDDLDNSMSKDSLADDSIGDSSASSEDNDYNSYKEKGKDDAPESEDDEAQLNSQDSLSILEGKDNAQESDDESQLKDEPSANILQGKDDAPESDSETLTKDEELFENAQKF